MLSFLSRSLVLCSVLAATSSQAAQAAGADYDGNGFAEVPVITTSNSGELTWNLFDPISGKTGVFTQGLGRAGDLPILANWLYSKVTSAGALSAPSAESGGRLVWTIRTAVRSGRSTSIQQHRKFLGRKGEIIISGGDFDGDGFSDALVLTNRGGGKYTWGLRGNFFVSSYNPGLNQNRAYFQFGRWGAEKPFFLNPDGNSDWFAVLACDRSDCLIRMTQPFSKEGRTIRVGKVSDPSRVPVPIAQDDGSDILGFISETRSSTTIEVKNLRGETVRTLHVPFAGDVTVGNYGPGPGEELCVSSQGRFFIINPITGRSITLSGPRGQAADSININTVF